MFYRIPLKTNAYEVNSKCYIDLRFGIMGKKKGGRISMVGGRKI